MPKMQSLVNTKASRKCDCMKRYSLYAKPIRNKLIERDGKLCKVCKEKQGIEIDHILPVFTHPEKQREINNLRLLCVTCHKIKSIEEIKLAMKQKRIAKAIEDLFREIEPKRAEICYKQKEFIAKIWMNGNSQVLTVPADLTEKLLITVGTRIRVKIEKME